MMHPTVYDFSDRICLKYGFNQPGFNVLEVGSQNVNGSVRDLFDKTNYWGVDIQSGVGVDEIANSHELPYVANSFDVVISTEHLEHDDQFWLTLREIERVLNDGGYLLLTARGIRDDGQGMFLHSYPNDYYRYTKQAFPRLFELFGFAMLEFEEDAFHPGFMALGQKI